MATYTTDQYIKKLQKLTLSMQDIKPFYEATNEIIIRQSERIFNKGIDSKGGSIGYYSPKPMLASKSQFIETSKWKQSYVDPDTGAIVESKVKGDKPLWLKFKKSKKAIPLMFIEGGYRQFKAIQGRNQTGKNVNLRYSGHFERGFHNSANPAKLSKSGFEIVYSVKHTGANSAGKVESIIERYPQAFKLSASEREYLLDKFRDIFITTILNKK